MVSQHYPSLSGSTVPPTALAKYIGSHLPLIILFQSGLLKFFYFALYLLFVNHFYRRSCLLLASGLKNQKE